MEKVLNVLYQEGWTDILVTDSLLVGFKDGLRRQALVVQGLIDFSQEFDFLFIAYDDEYLVYKVKQDVQG